jgi:phasin
MRQENHTADERKWGLQIATITELKHLADDTRRWGGGARFNQTRPLRMSVMNETTTNATTPKTEKRTGDPSKRAADPFELSSATMSKFEMPKIEVPVEFREMTGKGIAHAKDACTKAKLASDEAVDLLKNAYANVAKGATDYNLKVIDVVRTNTRAAFDHINGLLAVKSPSEFVELSTAHMRKQFDTISAQTKGLTALAQKAAEPIKTGVSKVFNKAP